MGSTVPSPTFGPNGFLVPDELTQILPAVQNDINAALGGGLNPSLETPQGQLASSIAAIVGNTNDAFLQMTQLFDPAYSFGRYQDALGRIYFIERIGAEATVVTATCAGAAGTVIPAGSVAQAADGNLYVCTTQGTIAAGGSVDLPFACVALGPITCPAHSLDQIYRAISGWDSIDNASDGVVGRDTETRAQFEERRYASVAKNAVGFLPALYGALLGVPGVLDAYVTENFTGSPLTINGFTLAAHSLYAAVVGGDQAAVAKAILSKKAPGCDMNGNTTVTVYDDVNYEPPYPAYAVKFESPASLPIVFAVNIVNSAQVPANAQALVAAAIVSAFSGSDGGSRARIGATLYASRYYGPVVALGAWAQIISLQIGSQNVPAASFTGVIADTALTVSAVTGTVAIGQTVVGAGVLPGTTILSGSGTSWVVSLSQTVSSEAMYGVAGDQNAVTVQIDQVPTIDETNVHVTLT
ncbi:MAG TPA: baseplate J/gp47 family protein [Gaiellaceae bacterium]